MGDSNSDCSSDYHDTVSSVSRASGEDTGALLSYITGTTLEKAIVELNENPETREDVVQELRELILQFKPVTAEEKGLIFINTDGKFLLMFLRARKFNVEKALHLYVSYHMFRHRHAHLIQDLSYDSVEKVFVSGVFKVLDARAKDGSKVLCVYPRNWNASMYPFLENFRATFLVLDKLIQDEETQVNGFSIVYDFTGASVMSMVHVAQSELITKGILIELLQDAFPARFKGIHLVHQPWYVSIVLSVIKPFMKQKLRDRIHSYGGNYEELHEHIHSHELPEEFGGMKGGDEAMLVIPSLF